MKPLEERLNDRLEQARLDIRRNGLHPGGLTLPERERESDPEVDGLVVLAQRLQQAHQIQVAPDFAGQLERRLLRRHAELRLQQRILRYSFFSLLRSRPVLSAVLGVCLLVCLMSISVLALAAQVTNPSNPLYGLKRWEQQVQVQMSGSSVAQASLDLQFVQDQLKALPANSAHTEAYRQALIELDEQIDTAAAAIDKLPAGAQHARLASELASVKRDAIQELRSLLPRLALPERLATTGELARLGDTVPTLTHATLVLPEHPNGQATIILEGSMIQAKAQLLVNGAVVDASGTFQPDQVVFAVAWNGELYPRSLGILNPDGTAAETTAITITGATNGNQSGHSNQPTPHGKPTVTPTPHGNRPEAIPTPHH
jgi:hypothetical protein